MNPLFADWHHDIALDLGGEVLLAREKAADEVVVALTGPQALDLIAIAYQQPAPSGDVTWFRQAFKTADVTFRMRDNDHEMAVLAGACLLEVGIRDDDIAVLAASAGAIAARRGWIPLLGDLLGAADQRLLDIGTSRRQRTDRPTVTRQQVWGPKGIAPAEITTVLQEGGDLPHPTHAAVAAALGKLALAVNTAIGHTANQLATVVDWADTSACLAAEESDLFGWLLCGASDLLDMTWSAVDPRTAAIVAGRELAQRAVVLPAPPQSDAMLEQLLASTPFAETSVKATLPPAPALRELDFLLADLGTDTDSDLLELAQHSLRQAMLVRVWGELE
jgi:hypothetical protein